MITICESEKDKNRRIQEKERQEHRNRQRDLATLLTASLPESYQVQTSYDDNNYITYNNEKTHCLGKINKLDHTNKLIEVEMFTRTWSHMRSNPPKLTDRQECFDFIEALNQKYPEYDIQVSIDSFCIKDIKLVDRDGAF